MNLRDTAKVNKEAQNFVQSTEFLIKILLENDRNNFKR